MPRATDDLAALNERQVWDMLGIDALLLQLVRRDAWSITENWLAVHKLATGLSCYKAIKLSGFLGPALENWDFFQRALSLMLEHSHFSWLDREFPFLFAKPDASAEKASFAEAAAFLDIVSDWIGCDDLLLFAFSNRGAVDQRAARFLRKIGGPLLPVSGRISMALFGAGIGNSRFLNAFHRYLDLAVDINSFRKKSNLTQSNKWIDMCFSFWFKHADPAIKLIDATAYQALGDGTSQFWSTRRGALIELRDNAQSSREELQHRGQAGHSAQSA